MMTWGRGGWPSYQPRPRVVRLEPQASERMVSCVRYFVEGSVVLRELVAEVESARGRVYLWRGPGDLMGRLTPVTAEAVILESPRRASWTEHGRGTPSEMLQLAERDREGTFHGLGALLAGDEHPPAVQQVLHRGFGIPVPVLAQPRYWYAMHRRPRIVESDAARGRVLVRFESESRTGEAISGTCLYAKRDGQWGCHAIRPNASANIASAEAWLEKRSWRGW
jgi:hypothetical protein